MLDELMYDIIKAKIRYHKFLYYQLANPEITDYEYDQLEQQFDLLAARLNKEGSWVGWRD